MIRPRLLPVLSILVAACGEPAPLPDCEEGAVGACVFPAWDFACVEDARPPCATTEPLSMDREVDALRPTLDGERRVYRVTGFTIPLAGTAEDGTGEDGTAVGFNLDALDSGPRRGDGATSCQEIRRDYRSATDPAHVGVDNALQSLIPAAEMLMDRADCPGGTTAGCIEARLDEAAASGALGLAFVVEGLDDLEADPRVRVTLRALAPGTPIELGERLGESAEASVFRGRVRARFDALSIPFPALTGIPLPPERHRRAELRFDLPSGDRPSEPAELALGAAIGVQDFLDALDAGVGLADFRSAVESILSSIADLAPRDADPGTCDELSVGYALRAVEVEAP